MRKFFAIISLLGSFLSGCMAQAPKLVYKSFAIETESKRMAKFVPAPKNAFDLADALPPGFQKNGTVDYTNHINASLKVQRVVKMPDFPVMVNYSGIIIPSNTQVYFQPNSKLILKPNKEQSYDIIKIENSENIAIYNADIEGDRRKHLGVKGEWGMGIGIRGSRNVEIRNAFIKDCWGDGIYIGATGKMSSDIRIFDFVIDYSRRNGVSVINVNGLEIGNGFIANTMGTAPQMGLDIEPNKPDDEIKNVKISNLETFNGRIGIGIVLNPFILSKFKKVVGITVTNHSDRSSQFPFRISGRDKTGMYKNAAKYITVDGTIDIVSPIWEKTLVDSDIFNGDLKRYDYDFLPLIKLRNVKILSGKGTDIIANPSVKQRLSKGRLQILK